QHRLVWLTARVMPRTILSNEGRWCNQCRIKCLVTGFILWLKRGAKRCRLRAIDRFGATPLPSRGKPLKDKAGWEAQLGSVAAFAASAKQSRAALLRSMR